MLLAFLRTRPGAVLLLDEPDAHLHVILQDAIYGELRAVAAQLRSQLIIATHSEVIINGAEPRELCVLFDGPRMLATTEEQARVILSLKVLSQTDMMLALNAPGVLYLENYTDRDILREWARVLGHPAHESLQLPDVLLEADGRGDTDGIAGHPGPPALRGAAARSRGPAGPGARRRRCAPGDPADRDHRARLPAAAVAALRDRELSGAS